MDMLHHSRHIYTDYVCLPEKQHIQTQIFFDYNKTGDEINNSNLPHSGQALNQFLKKNFYKKLSEYSQCIYPTQISS